MITVDIQCFIWGGGGREKPVAPALNVSVFPLVNFAGSKTSQKNHQMPPYNVKCSWGSMPPDPLYTLVLHNYKRYRVH